jgi:hypothetical protein
MKTLLQQKNSIGALNWSGVPESLGVPPMYDPDGSLTCILWPRLPVDCSFTKDVCMTRVKKE